MTEELCSRYGPLLQIWYDAGVKMPSQGGPDVLPIFEKHQPDSVFYHNWQRSDYRWIGNEKGYADYPCWSTMPGEEISHNAPSWKPILSNGDPDGTVWSPGMVDIPLRGAHGVHNWFWHPEQDYGVYSLLELVKIYDQSVGRNCNLVIGEVITPEGLVPEHDIKRLAEFGAEIKRQFDKPVVQFGSGEGLLFDVELDPPARVSAVVIQEDIAFGERIRAYELQGRTPSGNWQSLAQGTAVGHKRIERFEPVQLTGIRFEITKNRAKPKLKRIAVYDTNNS
jgi:alpha-L-fucosidase